MTRISSAWERPLQNSTRGTWQSCNSGQNVQYQGPQTIGHGHPGTHPIRSRVDNTTTASSPFGERAGDKGSKALKCATATTCAQTPVVSSTVAANVVQDTPKSIAAGLEEILPPVNAQHLNDWLTGYDPWTHAPMDIYLHTGFTKGFQINRRAAAGTLQQEGGCGTIDPPLKNRISWAKWSRKR